MALVMRWRTAVPLVLASIAGVLVSGCGKGQPLTVTQTTSAPSTTTQHAKAQGKQPQTPGTHAKAQAFAHAVNLRASDLPGFALSPERAPGHESTAEKRLQQQLHVCAGSVGGEAGSVLEASSGEYLRQATLARVSVSSQVSVEASAARAAQELEALHSDRLRSCLSSYFQQLLSRLGSHGTSVNRVSTKYGSPPAPGTAGSFGLRVTAMLTVHHVQLPFYLDYLTFVDGAAQVSLRTMGTPLPFPARLEERLFSLLVERAKANTA
jgi:hypothetical protein